MLHCHFQLLSTNARFPSYSLKPGVCSLPSADNVLHFLVPTKHKGRYPLDWKRSYPQQHWLQQGWDVGAVRWAKTARFPEQLPLRLPLWYPFCRKHHIQYEHEVTDKINLLPKNFVRCRHNPLPEGVQIFWVWGAASHKGRLCPFTSWEGSSSGLQRGEEKMLLRESDWQNCQLNQAI